MYGPKEHQKSGTVPLDYRVFEIGHNIAISKRQVDLTKPEAVSSLSFFKIINRKLIARDTRAVASADLPAAAGSVELSAKTYWKDWLESSDNTLYVLLAGFLTDHYAEWEVRYPSAERTGGIKSTPDNRWTQDDSPIWNPRLTVYAWEDEFPIFKLYNQSQYTMNIALIRIMGYKYVLAPVVGVPSPVSYVILEDVGTG